MHLAWCALSLARMRVRPGGFTHVFLQDLTPRVQRESIAVEARIPWPWHDLPFCRGAHDAFII